MKIRRTTVCASRICRRLLGTCLVLASGAGLAFGADSRWTGSSDVTFVDSYLWRGFKLAGNCIQPSLTAVYADKLTLAYWGSYGLKNEANGKYGETDFLASYVFSQKYFSVTIGGTLYGIDDLVDPESGVSFKYYFESLVSVTARVKFSPTLTYYREFGRLHTNYLEFSLSESYPLNKECRFTVRPYVGVFEKSQNYFGADISLNYEFGHGIYGIAKVTLTHSSFGGGADFDSPSSHASFGATVGWRW